MIAPEELNCASCGAPLDRALRYTRMLVCDYCGATNLLNAGSLEAAHEKVLLTDYGSPVELYKTVTIDGGVYEARGRVRYAYEDGFWDEWLLHSKAEPEALYWLHEDEGEFLLYQALYDPEDPETLLSPESAKFEDFVVGQQYELNGRNVFVSEKSRGKVVGSEGELPFQVLPGESADFVDGYWAKQELFLSLEFFPEGGYLYAGREVSLDAMRRYYPV